MANNIPITAGSGAASVAAETVGGISYQQIEVYGGGGASVLGINPDHSINASIIGNPTFFVAGSVATVGTAVANQSVSGAVQLAGASPASIMTVTRLDNQVIGSMQGLVGQVVIHGLTSAGGGSYVDVKVDPSGALVTALGSVVAFQGAGWSGSVAAAQIGTRTTSVVSSTPSSMLAGASIFGQLPAGTAPLGSVATLQGTNPWIVTGSVQAAVSGSVAATVTNTVTVVSSLAGGLFPVSGSVAATIVGTPNVNTAGSVAAFQAGTWKTSVATEYATGAASIISAQGELVLGVRNDTLASVMATANGQYGPMTVGSWGDNIVSFAPSSVWASGVASCFTGVEQPVIVSVLGRRVNVTGVQIANTSANNVYMSFYGSGIGSVTGSIIGFTIAPANGGSNINFPVPLQTANNSGFSASVSGVASVYVSAQGFYSAV